jgi:hypothetical protein
MVTYECDICKFNSIRKTDYTRHLKTLKHKKNEETQGIKEHKSIKKDHKKTILGPFLEKKETILGPQKDHFCPHCNKGFKYKTHLYRHQKHYCKILKEEKIENEKLKLLIEKQNDEHQKEKQKLYDYIDKLIDKTGDTYNIEQQNNQINLNNFGHEDISHLTDNFMHRLLSIPYVGVQKLIEKVHFNKKKPENKNIALTNKKEKMIKIFKNNKWKYKNREEIMDEIININYTRMDDFYSEKGRDKLKNNHNNKYIEFQEKFEDQDKDLHEKIKNECEMILLSDNL